MLTRALIVMLAVLNMGVALWWWLRPHAAPPLPTLANDVVVLELLSPLAEPTAWVDRSFTQDASSLIPDVSLTDENEQEGDAEVGTELDEEELELAPEADNEALALASNNEIQDVTRTETDISQTASDTAETDSNIGDMAAAIAPLEETPPEVASEAEAAIPQCVSLGPFTQMPQVQAALRALGSDVERFRLREVVVPADTRYRILIPPAPSREHAQAEVERIAAAGFSDYFIINEGEDTHAIALGQFRNRQGAENRLTQLRAAGFAAQLHTTTEVPHSNWWIDTAPTTGVTPATLQQRSSAAQWQVLDCARLR